MNITEDDANDVINDVVDVTAPSGVQCYCNLPRDFNTPDFQCSVCYKWFHLNCIAFNIGKALPFLTAYHFMCKRCNSSGEEIFTRKQANFTVMCQTVLANLMFKHNGRLYFMESKELIPFLEQYWEELTTQPRRSNNSCDVFRTLERNNELYVCLSNTDLNKLGPSYDRFRALTSQLRTNITKLGASSVNLSSLNHTEVDQNMGQVSTNSNECDVNGDVPSWRKRKSPGSGLSSGICTFSNSANGSATSSTTITSTNDVSTMGLSNTDNAVYGGVKNIGQNNNETSSNLSGGLVRSTRRTAASSVLGGTTPLGATPNYSSVDEGRTKLNALGFPTDHALNKEGYRYILVEPDKHAVGREKWDECEFTAGKPIPGLFYRVYMCPQVALSLSDRANHLKLHESQMLVTGDKGYCMVRATHSVNCGNWYFEATITEQPEGAAARIGFSQMYGNLQAPAGYDKFSYSWRSRLGTVFHDSRGKHYAEEGYKKDDVIGCMICLPSSLDKSPFTLVGNDNSNGEFKKPQSNSSMGSKLIGGLLLNSNQNKSKVPYKVNNHLPETYKDRPLIRFRNSFYFEEKDEPMKAEKLLQSLEGSKIIFYRNGKCLGTAFSNIYAGSYYPAVSIYRSATVSLNFGPNLKYPPEGDNWQPFSERLVSAAVEQTVSDLIYLVEKDGFVENMINSCSGT